MKGIKLNELVRSVRKKLCHSFLNYCNKKSKEPEGKLDTYFKIKKCFSREKSHINFASLGRSLNFGQSSPILLNMISLLSM
jgi:hypothetical protein